MQIEVHGHHLPGRTFHDGDEVRREVHVAVQVRQEAVGPVPGDADSAAWTVDARVVDEAGALDLRGPAVHGRRGERFLYLTWGEVGDDGTFAMFRRAKLVLDRVDPALVRRAAAAGTPLVATVHLTDDRGGPRCARVDPPALTWST
ncbi:hypothetical protein KSP35_10240 [Aquihabitans sp. G128]|uniref:DUF5990 family protein n=1 Tax=Aquihabitans sp. G128 TaxID=2849779 RepID=UPI001C2244E8|nr:DUF5990 family protein [Aquihabitans sp. G128]QXC63120.1 hypothetical protein KSP35_10240 [Aquihabitans sp. G128]